MWQCRKCGENIEDSFDACWSCGTSRDGVEDPVFGPVVDQPELDVGLSSKPTVRGAKAGVAVSVPLAFLHPIVLVIPVCLVGVVPDWWYAFRFVILFGLWWAAFAAIGGGVGGAIGARVQTKQSALIAGLLSCAFFHVLFLTAFTGGLGAWRPEVLLTSFGIAAITGAVAGHMGFASGRRLASGHAD
jgi:hypothetical protein